MGHLLLALLPALAILTGDGSAEGLKPEPVGTPRADAEVVVYGDQEFDVYPEDGPVVVFLIERVETREGVTVEGVAFLADGAGGWVAQPFGPAPASGDLAEAGFDTPVTLGGCDDA